MPDYRLAPENPFPAGVRDAEACYRGLVALGFRAIALSGDSAGGNLALVLLSLLTPRTSSGGMVPTAAGALSPVTPTSRDRRSRGWCAHISATPI